MKPSGQNISDMRKLLSYISWMRPASIDGMARDIGWVTESGVPNKSKVRRTLASIERNGLASYKSGYWTVASNWDERLLQMQMTDGPTDGQPVDKLPLRMAWMLVYLKTCAVYLAENNHDAYLECALDQHKDELDRLIKEAAPLLLGPADSQD